jgi:hypothetical protein
MSLRALTLATINFLTTGLKPAVTQFAKIDSTRHVVRITSFQSSLRSSENSVIAHNPVFDKIPATGSDLICVTLRILPSRSPCLNLSCADQNV